MLYYTIHVYLYINREENLQNELLDLSRISTEGLNGEEAVAAVEA